MVSPSLGLHCKFINHMMCVLVPCALSDTSSKGIETDAAAGGNVVSLRAPGWGNTSASVLSVR